MANKILLVVLTILLAPLGILWGLACFALVAVPTFFVAAKLGLIR